MLIFTFGVNEGQRLQAEQLVCDGAVIQTQAVSLQSYTAFRHCTLGVGVFGGRRGDVWEGQVWAQVQY